MSTFRLPLSGNVPVLQDFNPFNWSFGPNAQLSFLKVDVGETRDPDVEQAILAVASYGRQLGRLSEALQAVLAHLPLGDYTPAQKAAIEDFQSLMREIGDAKKKAMNAG
jgi:hypothetical protein